MIIINSTIWLFIIFLILFGIECFIHPPEGDYGQTAGFALGCALILFYLWIMLNYQKL